MERAPDHIVRAVLDVLYVAAYTTRNAALDDTMSRAHVHDLWDALHSLPRDVMRWRSDSESFLLTCLDAYDENWKLPSLREIYERARDAGD